jgi:putative ABC transport system permease protein
VGSGARRPRVRGGHGGAVPARGEGGDAVKYLPLLWAGLFRKKARTVLTLSSVTVAFLLLGLLQSVEVAFRSGVETADAKRLLTTARYSIIEPLPLSYLVQIEQVPGVAGAAYADWFGAKYQNESNAFPVFAVDPRRYLAMYPEFTVAPAQLEAFATTRTGAVAGVRLVNRFGWKIGQKLPIASEIHARADGDMNWTFDLVGVLDADDPAQRGNTDVVLINATYFDEARREGKGKTGWYIVRVVDASRARAIAADIDHRFMNSPDETKTQPEKEFALGFAKQIGDIGALVSRILAAVFFTILILTGNTMAQSIRERIPELAILKTLGFSDGRVSALVLAEAGLLLVIGGALGLAAAVAVMPMLNGATGGRFPPLFVTGRTWLVAGAVAGALALAIGLPPAIRARRLEIVDALGGHR